MNRYRNFYAFLLSRVIYSMCMRATMMALPILYKGCGLTEVQIGIIMVSSTIPGAVANLPLGWISDNIGRKPIILFSTFLYAVSWLPLLLSKTFLVFLISAITVGIVTGPDMLAASAFVADLFEPKERGGALGILNAGREVGRLVGPILGSFILATFFYNGYLFFMFGACGLSVIIVTTLVKESKIRTLSLRESLRIGKSNRSIKISLNFARAIKENRNMILYFFGRSLQLGHYMCHVFLSLYCSEIIRISVGQIGLIFSISAFITIVLSPFVGRLCDRVGRKTPLIAGMIGNVITLILYAQAKSFTDLLLFSIFDWITLQFFTISANTFLLDLIPKSRRGTGLGAFQTFNRFMQGIMSFIGGWAIYSYGWNTTFFLGACLVGGGIFMYVMIPETPKFDE